MPAEKRKFHCRAHELRSRGRDVKLVDLDLVEPFFTIRPIVNQLEEKGLSYFHGHRGVVGLGETGVLFVQK